MDVQEVHGYVEEVLNSLAADVPKVGGSFLNFAGLFIIVGDLWKCSKTFGNGFEGSCSSQSWEQKKTYGISYKALSGWRVLISLHKEKERLFLFTKKRIEKQLSKTVYTVNGLICT